MPLQHKLRSKNQCGIWGATQNATHPPRAFARKDLVPSICAATSNAMYAESYVHSCSNLHDQAVQRKANKLQEIKSQAMVILDRVIPELEAAYAGIDTLTKRDMVEARDVTPKQCRLVCEAICVLMDKNPEIVGTES